MNELGAIFMTLEGQVDERGCLTGHHRPDLDGYEPFLIELDPTSITARALPVDLSGDPDHETDPLHHEGIGQLLR